jgi:hypothetical protein
LSILEEAARIVDGSRRNDYGNPLDNWTDTSAIWNVLLRKKLNAPITADDAVLMMIAVKLARESHAPKHDNAVDIAGYARCLEMLREERERRADGTGSNGS